MFLLDCLSKLFCSHFKKKTFLYVLESSKGMDVNISSQSLNQVKRHYIEFTDSMKGYTVESFAVLFPMNMHKVERLDAYHDNFSVLKTSAYLNHSNAGKLNASLWNILNRVNIKTHRESGEDIGAYYINIVLPTMQERANFVDSPFLLVEFSIWNNYFKKNSSMAQFSGDYADKIAKSIISAGVRNDINPYWIAANYDFLSTGSFINDQKLINERRSEFPFDFHTKQLETILESANIPLVKEK